jgi:metal-responsive CopG/Arc/MetJ family transcriptional regulator
MIRVQVYLSAELINALDRLARGRGETRSRVLRRAVQRFLEQEAGLDDPIFGIVGLGCSGTGDASENHDQVLIEHMLKSRG